MRIAVISVHGCPCIQPGGIDAGGMNVYVDQVSSRLARLGYSICVYSRSHRDQLHGGDRLEYELVHIPVGEPDLPKALLPGILPDFVSTVADHAKRDERNYDLVASHYWLSGVVGCELSRIWEVPHVTSFHTMASIKKRFRPEEEEPEIRFLNEARIARDADAVIVWTDGEAAHMSSEFVLSPRTIAVVPPGVDTEKFAPTPARARKSKTSSILYVGRLDALKGVDLLIDAFAAVVARGVDAELHIVGGGSADEFRRVLGHISKLRLTDRVKIPGLLPQSDLTNVYSDADCIVAPSFHETFGLAVLEAASCGTPAVAADVDGLRAIVDHGATGFLIGERDSKIYADKIIEIITDDTVQSSMSMAARRKAETLSWDTSVEGLMEVYNQVATLHFSSVSLR